MNQPDLFAQRTIVPTLAIAATAAHLEEKRRAAIDKARQLMKLTPPENLPWIFGPHNAENRRAVMLILTGQRLPKAKCGINAMMAELYRVFPVKKCCQRNMEIELAEAIRLAADCVRRGWLRIKANDLQCGCPCAFTGARFEFSDGPYEIADRHGIKAVDELEKEIGTALAAGIVAGTWNRYQWTFESRD